MRSLVLVWAVVSITGCAPRTDLAPLVAVRDPGGATDPINMVDLEALHQDAARVLRELIDALPDRHRARVASVHVVRDNALGDVNAYATCDEHGPFVAISDGLLAITAHLAMGTATDELFETTKAGEYLVWLGAHGLAPPPVRFYDAAQHTDRRKVLRQQEILDEELAFVLGHELAHHYLGHLPCNTRNELESLGQVAASVPVFNQAAELAADTAATRNLLDAGRLRPGYTWTEDGALLVMAAFNRHRPVGARDVLLAFERTHPVPHLRVPAITVAAEMWHSSGGHLPLF